MGKGKLLLKTLPAAALALMLAVPSAQAAPSFADVTREAPWALGSVVELTQRGVFGGYPDGSFQPNRDISRIETIVAIVRHMGLRAEAESFEAKQSKLSAADAPLIRKDYAWAVGYVDVAEDNNLLIDENAALKPWASADRAWATTLLVRALGLERQAEAAMTFELPFADSADIPEASVGYVAVAVQYGLVSGYEDNTFRPKRLVSRAELATLLDRAGDKLPNVDGPFLQASGVVSGVNGNNVTVTQQAAIQTFYIPPEATIVRAGRLVASDELQLGDELTMVLRGGQVVHMSVTSAASVEDGTKSGAIASIGDGVLAIDENGVRREYKVSEQVTVYLNAVLGRWADLKVGDSVTATVSGGFVTKIETKQTSLQNARIVGTVKEVAGTNLTITVDGADATYPLRSDTAVVVNNVPGVISNVRKGDLATVVIAGGAVFHISVTQSTPSLNEATGYVSNVYPNQLLIANEGQTNVYTLASNAQVYREGIGVGLADIKPGDRVKAVLQNNAVFILTVIDPVDVDEDFMELEGVYQSHLSPAGGKITEITVTVQYEGNPIVRTFPVWSDAMIRSATDGSYLNGAKTPALFPNVTKVKLLVVNRTVTIVDIL